MFAAIDKDGNGQLTPAEYQAFQVFKKDKPSWVQILKTQLKNKK